MAIQVLACPKCGAPLPPSARAIVGCPYCGVSLAGVPFAGYLVDGPPPPALAEAAWNDASAPRFSVAGRPFVLLGRLGSGRMSEVFLARSDRTLTELVVVKVPRSIDDGPRLLREFSRLESLASASAQGAAHFSRLVPQRVVHGRLESPDGSVRAASVFRFRSGFQHTFEEVRAAFPGGIDPRHAVWMGRRILEVLGFVHAAGLVHGALFPWHLLVHPRDHGVVFCGTSRLSHVGQATDDSPWDASEAPYVPDAQRGGAQPTQASDVAMAARSLVYVMGGEPASASLPVSVPEPLRGVVVRAASGGDRGGPGLAWNLVNELGEAARSVYGPPSFIPFSLPSWS